MAKDELAVSRVETVKLDFYAVRNRDGKWLRSKGYGGFGKCWVDDISAAWRARTGPSASSCTTATISHRSGASC